MRSSIISITFACEVNYVRCGFLNDVGGSAVQCGNSIVFNDALAACGVGGVQETLGHRRIHNTVITTIECDGA